MMPFINILMLLIDCEWALTIKSYLLDLKSGNSRNTAIYFWSGFIKKKSFYYYSFKISDRYPGLHKLQFSNTRFRASKTVLGARPCT